MPRPQGTPLGRKLATTSKAVGTAFNAALGEAGGSVPVWLILSSLKHGRPSTQLELARSLDIEGPTLTRHLDNLEQAVRYATAAGALACTRMGAQPSLPTRGEVEGLLAGLETA